MAAVQGCHGFCMRRLAPEVGAKQKNHASPFRKRTRGYIFVPFVFISGISS
jgi:hypothetical protein